MADVKDAVTWGIEVRHDREDVPLAGGGSYRVRDTRSGRLEGPRGALPADVDQVGIRFGPVLARDRRGAVYVVTEAVLARVDDGCWFNLGDNILDSPARFG